MRRFVSLLKQLQSTQSVHNSNIYFLFSIDLSLSVLLSIVRIAHFPSIFIGKEPMFPKNEMISKGANEQLIKMKKKELSNSKQFTLAMND